MYNVYLLPINDVSGRQCFQSYLSVCVHGALDVTTTHDVIGQLQITWNPPPHCSPVFIWGPTGPQPEPSHTSSNLFSWASPGNPSQTCLNLLSYHIGTIFNVKL